MRADLLVTGRIATLAGSDGFGWREAVAIAAGHVVATGTRAELSDLTASRRLDLAPDEIAIPGFTDAHLHLGDAALAARQLDLRAAATLEDALAAIAARHAALPAGEWLLGFGWQSALWGGWPTAADLERVAPGRLAFLWSHDHHAAWLSEPALALAGIGDRGAMPATSLIRRDDTGRPTGILHEDGVRIGAAVLPQVTTESLAAAIEAYAGDLSRLGVLAVHDPGPLTPDPDLRRDVAACRLLAERGALPVRVHVSVRPDGLPAAFERGLRTGENLLAAESGLPPELRGRCRVGWLKLFADGALGSRTAAMLEPYEPEPGRLLPAGDRGILTTPVAELVALVQSAAEHGIVTQIHAIGDAAVRAALDAFETAGPAVRPAHGPMARIEHAQLVAPADMPRFASLGVVASVQPSHLGTDAVGAKAAWGNRADRSAYAYGSLAAAGAVLALGSDAPVEVSDPWAALSYAILRSPRRGIEPVLGADQALTPAAALRGGCAGPAIAAGDVRLGTLVAGSPADLLVVRADALEDPAAARPIAIFSAGRELA